MGNGSFVFNFGQIVVKKYQKEAENAQKEQKSGPKMGDLLLTSSSRRLKVKTTAS
jgi:hypothetical protein